MKIVARLFCIFLAAGLTFAHDMWLESQSFIVDKAGDRVIIRNGNGTIYQKSENAVTPERLAVLMARGPSGAAVELDTPTVDDVWLISGFTPAKPGNYWVGLATKPRMIRMSGEDFTAYLEHDGIPKVIEEREEKGISDRDEVEQYSKYVKAYLQVGGENNPNFDEPLGLTIEIVPLANPYDLPVGATLPVQVLFRGHPLDGLTLHAGHEGQAEATASIDTDQEGRAEIPLVAAGKWYVRGIHLSQVDQEDHTYESYWAALTFQVPR